MAQSRNLSGCQFFHVENLPPGWDCVPLKERLELLYGRALREEDRRPGEVDVFGSNGKVGTHNSQWLEAPGILVGRKGTVGAVHYASRAFWPIDTVYYVKPIAEDRLQYLYYLLNYLPLAFLNAATGVPGLSRRDAYALRGAFPPPNEQAAIACILDAVDTVIERTREAVERAATLRTSLLADVFQRMEAKPIRIGEFATDVRYGTSQASSGRGWGNPVLRIPNVIGNELKLDDLAYVDLRPVDVDRLLLRDGDLLLVRTNGNPSYVGRSVVFRRPDEREWVYASYLIRVRLNEKLLPDYVNVFLEIERGRREILQRVTTSAGNYNINSNSIRLISIPMPKKKEEQEQVIEIAQKCRMHMTALKKKLSALLELKKSLMHDLLTGKVRVG